MQSTQKKRNIQIIGHGYYLPQRIVSSEEIDVMAQQEIGTVEKKIGIKSRRYVDRKDEYLSSMAAQAIQRALEMANLKLSDIDGIVSASGTGEQELPCNAALILGELLKLSDNSTAKKSHRPATFDIDSTCLSFITALDVVSYLVDARRFKRVVVVSSEVASVALNYRELESCSLFGDGAAAMIIQTTPAEQSSALLISHMETYAEGLDFCQIEGGGSKLPTEHYLDPEHREKFLFRMNGKEVFKLASKVTPPFIEQLLGNLKLCPSDIKMVIPHQASPSGLEILRRKTGFNTDQWMNIIEDHGNMIASSIPLAFSYALEQNKIQRGDKVLLVGTSAGFSLGGMVLEY